MGNMAYVALYRTWRPQTFDDLVGQQPIKTALTNALSTGRISHAYLFAGPRGTGKTSTARILAKALNCEHGPTAHPCGKCTNCREITQGTSADVIEIDAASNRGIDEIRKLREQVYFAPVSSRYKVYIIDEVHMITTDAFNALLKTLEEPPEHVIFILATTDPQRILPTILSRCQRYDFHRATVGEIAEHLQKVANGSGIKAEPEALELMAIQADGGLRDALSLLDQCSVMASPVTRDTVRQVLGIVGREKLRQLVEEIGRKNLAGALDTLSELLEQGKEIEQILVELLEYFRALLLYRADRDYQEIYLTDTAEALEKLCTLFSRAQIISCVERIHRAIGDSKRSLRKKIVGELCLFDLCENKDETQAALAARIDELEQQLKKLKEEGITAVPGTWDTSPQPANQPVSAVPLPEVRTSVAGPQTEDKPSAPPAGNMRRTAWYDAPEFTAQPETAVPASESTAKALESKPHAETGFRKAPAMLKPRFKAADGPIYVTEQGAVQGRSLWSNVIKGLAKSGKKAYSVYAGQAQAITLTDAALVIEAKNEFAKSRLEESDIHNRFFSLLKSLTGQALGLTILIKEEEGRLVRQAPGQRETVPQAAIPPEKQAELPPETLPEDDIPLPEPSDEEYAQAAEEPELTELPDSVKKAMQVFGGKPEKIAKSEE